MMLIFNLFMKKLRPQSAKYRADIQRKLQESRREGQSYNLGLLQTRLIPKIIESDKERLYSQTIQLKEANQALSDQLTRIKTKCLRLQKNNNKIPVSNKSLILLREMLNENSEQINYLKTQNRRLKKNIKHTKVEQLQIERDILHEQLFSMKNKLEEQVRNRSQLEQFRLQIGNLKAELQIMQQENQNLRKQNKILKEESNRLVQLNADHQRKIRSLQCKYLLQKKQMNKSLSEAQLKFLSLQEYITKITEQKTSISQRLQKSELNLRANSKLVKTSQLKQFSQLKLLLQYRRVAFGLSIQSAISEIKKNHQNTVSFQQVIQILKHKPFLVDMRTMEQLLKILQLSEQQNVQTNEFVERLSKFLQKDLQISNQSYSESLSNVADKLKTRMGSIIRQLRRKQDCKQNIDQTSLRKVLSIYLNQRQLKCLIAQMSLTSRSLHELNYKSTFNMLSSHIFVND